MKMCQMNGRYDELNEIFTYRGRRIQEVVRKISAQTVIFPVQRDHALVQVWCCMIIYKKERLQFFFK